MSGVDVMGGWAATGGRVLVAWLIPWNSCHSWIVCVLVGGGRWDSPEGVFVREPPRGTSVCIVPPLSARPRAFPPTHPPHLIPQLRRGPVDVVPEQQPQDPTGDRGRPRHEQQLEDRRRLGRLLRAP